MRTRTSTSNRRPALGLVLALSVALLSSGLEHTTAYGAPGDQAADGSVSLVTPFPNRPAPSFDDRAAAMTSPGTAVNYVSPFTILKVDAVNGLAFEFTTINEPAGQNRTCPGGGTEEVVKYDLMTGHPLDLACPTFDGQNFYPYGQQFAEVNSYEDQSVIDSTSRLIFQPQVAANNAYTEIWAMSEDTMSLAGGICLGPTGPVVAAPNSIDSSFQCDEPAAVGSATSAPEYPYFRGMSWYRPDDDLVVLTDGRTRGNNGTTPVSLGTSASVYHVSRTQSGGMTLTPRFTIHLPPTLCAVGPFFSDSYSVFGAYLSEVQSDPALFVPCDAPSPDLAIENANTRFQIVKVPVPRACLDATESCTVPDPPTTTAVTPAPGPVGALLFDPVGERGFMLPTTSAQGAVKGGTVLVYDGVGAGSILGRFNIEPDTQRIGHYLFALDSQTGRFYADDPATGLRIVDGRRTPVGTGSFYPQVVSPYGQPAAIQELQIAPPDETHPYPRVMLGLATTKDGRVDYFTVFADRTAVTHDPPPSSVDAQTYSGSIPPGADASTTYAVHAAGYGVHSDLVGGYWGVYQNSSVNQRAGVPVPPGGGQTLDVLAGAVPSSGVSDGSAQAQASATYDANRNATGLYRSCSDGFSPQSCLPGCDLTQLLWLSNFQQDLGPPPVPLDPCAPVLQQYANAVQAQTGGQSSTAQEWPYPTVECSNPGGAPYQDAEGLTQTPQHSTDSSAPPPQQQEFFTAPSPAPSPTVSSRAVTGAKAVADCRDGTVSTLSQAQCLAVSSPPSAPADSSTCDQATQALTVAHAETTTQVTPPSSISDPAKATVTAVASGIHLTLPDGTTLDIGHISQQATVQAAGQQGSASTRRTVQLADVRVTPQGGQTREICAGSCDNLDLSTILDALNAVDPSHLYVSFPAPAEPFGFEVDGVSPAGSPGGAAAAVQADPAEQQGDATFNEMTGFKSEKAILPAMRVVLYNPGEIQVSREVLDFAGVEADATKSLDVNAAFTGGGGDTTPIVDPTQAMLDAGVPAAVAGVSTPSPEPPNQPAAVTNYHSGLLGVLERTLDGLRWLARSPLGGLQMAAFLVMLGLPLMLSRRRWTWRRG